MNEKKFENFEWSKQKECNNKEIQAHRWRNFLFAAAIALNLANTSCDFIPSREQRVANRIARREARADQRAAISANEMTHVKFLVNSHVSAYKNLVKKHKELVSEIQPGQRNSVLEHNIRLVESKITDCENEISKYSERYWNLYYTVSTNSGWSTMIKTYDEWKYDYLIKVVNESN